MSDKLYDFSTGKYVNCSDLTKDGTKWINRNRKEVVCDENIENYADNKGYYKHDVKRSEFLRFIRCNDYDFGYLFVLRELGYNPQRIAYIMNCHKRTIYKRLTYLKRIYKAFLEY